jgi:hypothetical protein
MWVSRSCRFRPCVGIAVAGVGLGATLVPQYTQYLIGAFGWRYAYGGLGCSFWQSPCPVSSSLFASRPKGLLTTPLRASHPAILPSCTVRPRYEGDADERSVLDAGRCHLAGVDGRQQHGGACRGALDRTWVFATAAAGLTAAVGLSTMAGRLLMEFLVNFILAPYVAAFFFLLPCIRDNRLQGDRLSEWTPSTITKT